MVLRILNVNNAVTNMVAAFIGIVSLVTSSLVVPPPVAFAQETGQDRTDLYVTGATITRANGASHDTPIYVSDSIGFTFTWDASAYAGTPQAPKPGDFIQAELPPWLNFPSGQLSMRNGSGLVVAQCDQISKTPTEASRVRCVFTDAVITNPRQLQGGYDSTARAVETAVIDPRTFNVGTHTVDVATILTPAGGTAIERRQVANNPDFLKDSSEKNGIMHDTAGGRGILWRILVAGNGGPITIEDELAAPQEITAVQVRSRNRVDEGNNGGSWNLTTDVTPGTATTISDDYIQRIPTGRGTTILRVDLPTSQVGDVYQIRVNTRVPLDAYKNGDMVGNTATVNGEKIEASLRAHNMASAYGTGNPDQGNLNIYKSLDDPTGAAANSDDTFQVEATWEQDGQQRREVLDLKTSAPASLNNLPKDTVVTVRELTPQPTARYGWADPTFASGKYGNVADTNVTVSDNKQSAQVKIRGNDTVLLNVLNPVVAQVKTGEFKIKKIVDWADNPQQKFRVNYVCSAPGTTTAGEVVPAQGSVELVPNAEATTVGSFPVGTECTIDEPVNGRDIPNYETIGDPIYSPENGALTIKEGTGEENLVTVTNSYRRATSTLKVGKRVVVGNPPLIRDLTYVFNYECWDPTVPRPERISAEHKGSLTVVGEGETEESKPIPAGFTCDVFEDSTSAYSQSHDVTTEGLKNVMIEQGKTAVVEFTNTHFRRTSGFRVHKNVSGIDEELIKDKEFIFDYFCWDHSEVKPASKDDVDDHLKGTITVTGQGVENFYGVQTGYKCAVSEDPSSAQVDGYRVTIPPAQEIFVVTGDTSDVVFENKYEKATGQVTITKRVTGTNYGNFEFDFDYECTDGKKGEITVPGNGVPVPLPGDFEPNTSCTISEREPRGRMGEEVFDPPGPQRVTVTDTAVAANAEFVNHYEKIGIIIVHKKIVGVEENDKKFTFNFKCDDNKQGSFEVSVNEPASLPALLRDGTNCDIAEDPASAEIPGYTLTLPPAPISATAVWGDTNNVWVTNTYEKNPDPTGSLSVAKKVVGVDAALAAAEDFTFTYECTEGSKGTVLIKGDGKAHEVQANLPLGTECTVAEEGAPAVIDGLLHNGMADPQTVAITADTAALEFENSYAAVPPQLVSFSIAKTVVGAQVPADKKFNFTYACGRTQNTVEVAADGNPVFVPGLFREGTECEVSEQQDSTALDGYTLTALPAPQKLTVTAGAKVEFTNTYEKNPEPMGTFSVVKKLVGLDAADQKAAEAASFQVDYTCGADKGTLVVPGDGTPVSPDQMFPLGTECSFAETGEKNPVEGTYTVVDSVNTPTVTIAADPATVEVTNTFTKKTGGFSVAKQVTGADAGVAADKDFTFAYECSEGTKGMVVVKGDGQAKQAEGTLPVGTQCTITEDLSHAEVDDHHLVGSPDPQTITIGDVPQTITFTNNYARNTGRFSIAKTVTGGPFTGDNFTFDYTCGTTQGSLTVRGDAVAVTSEEFPVGTTCIIAENVEKAARDGYQLTSAANKATVTIGNGTVVNVAATNTYMELGRVQVTSETADKEYSFVATWNEKQPDGTTVAKQQEFSLRGGQSFTDIPALPVGATIMVKTTKPAQGNEARWTTPTFSSVLAGLVHDNGDGTALITIQPGTFTTPGQVVVRAPEENIGIPWWWYATGIGIVGLAAGSAHGFSVGSSTPQAPQVTTPTPKPGPAKGVEKQHAQPTTATQAAPKQEQAGERGVEKRDKQLARTGANVLALIAVAGLVLAAGALMVARARRNT